MALSHVEGNCKEENAALHDQCGWDKKEQASGEQWKVKIGPESERGGDGKNNPTQPSPFSNSRDSSSDLSSDRISITESCKEKVKQTYTRNSLDAGFCS